MVANNFLGLSNKVTIILSSFPSLESSFKSDCVNEKKATSVPEISAELISKPISASTFIDVKKSKEAIKSNNGSGSGSKFKSFGY